MVRHFHSTVVWTTEPSPIDVLVQRIIQSKRRLISNRCYDYYDPYPSEALRRSIPMGHRVNSSMVSGSLLVRSNDLPWSQDEERTNPIISQTINVKK